MPTFSSVFDHQSIEIRNIVARTKCPSMSRLGEILGPDRTAPFEISELSELLEIGRAPEAREQFNALREFVFSRYRKPEMNSVRYVAPIYVSSFCVDTCAYCNFSALRTATERKRLSLEELREEIDSVMTSGARVLELVFASDPEFTTDRLVQYVGTAKDALMGEPGSAVLLCTEYLSGEAYRALKDAGLSGIVQWDETLDPHAYERWHASSPHKREFRLRMDNHDRAQAAGLSVATGALLGLGEYRYDALMQIVKARHLASEYGRAPFVFGVPRLKPVAGHELHLQTNVSDIAYETILMVYRLAMPDSGRWLQTRETFSMNLANLLDGDVFTYRCGEVRPGGNHKAAGSLLSSAPPLKAGQFGVNELDRDIVERELAAHNFRIEYAWDKEAGGAQSGRAEELEEQASGIIGT